MDELISCDIGRQDFQRHFAIKLGILGQIHFTHAACAKLADNAVMRKD
jgi:hypothetical protein